MKISIVSIVIAFVAAILVAVVLALARAGSLIAYTQIKQ
jgi:hypothetical protein